MQWALLDTKYLVDSKKEDQLQHCTRTWVLTPIVVLSASNFKNDEIRSCHAFSSKINPTCHWQSTRLVQHTPTLTANASWWAVLACQHPQTPPSFQMWVGGVFSLSIHIHRPTLAANASWWAVLMQQHLHGPYPCSKCKLVLPCRDIFYIIHN